MLTEGWMVPDEKSLELFLKKARRIKSSDPNDPNIPQHKPFDIDKFDNYWKRNSLPDFRICPRGEKIISRHQSADVPAGKGS
jgi:hypothetical protein